MIVRASQWRGELNRPYDTLPAGLSPGAIRVVTLPALEAIGSALAIVDKARRRSARLAHVDTANDSVLRCTLPSDVKILSTRGENRD